MSEQADTNTILRDLLFEQIREKKRVRSWRLFFILLFLCLIAYNFTLLSNKSKKFARQAEHIAMIKIHGIIAYDREASSERVISALKQAAANPKAKAIVLQINSPGGTPYQARAIYLYLKQMRQFYPDKKIYALIEDFGTSGAYWVAVGANQVYADSISMIGSVGVLYNGFGLENTIKKLGINRRILTAGQDKASLDSFSPFNEKDKKYLQSQLDNIHQVFIKNIQAERGKKLSKKVNWHSGRVWLGNDAIKIGLIDGLLDLDSLIKEVIGIEKTVEYHGEEKFLDNFLNKINFSSKSFNLKFPIIDIS